MSTKPEAEERNDDNTVILEMWSWELHLRVSGINRGPSVEREGVRASDMEKDERDCWAGMRPTEVEEKAGYWY